jgi:hypothetical protein
MQCSKQTRFGFLVLDFPGLEFILAPFVSDFVLRISDLFRQVLGTMTFFVTAVGA